LEYAQNVIRKEYERVVWLRSIPANIVGGLVEYQRHTRWEIVGADKMLESLKKIGQDFAIKEASQKATEELLKNIKPYVEGEMRKMEAEFSRMAEYINALEKRVIKLEERKEKEGKL